MSRVSSARAGSAVLLAAGAAGAVAVVLVIASVAGAVPYARLDNPDPGTFVRLLSPAARLVADLSAALVTGFLAFAVLVTGPRERGLLSGIGYRAVRSAGWWTLPWAASALCLLVVDSAGAAGVAPSRLLTPHGFWVVLQVTETPKAWLATVILVAVTAVGCRLILRWRSAVGMLAVAVVALWPPVAVGHLASEAAHDLGTDAILIHVTAAAVWVGFVVAFVLWFPRVRAARTGLVARRYRQVAGVCWVLLAASGAVQAAVLTPWPRLFDTRYGALELAAAAALIALGAVGVLFRRRVLRGGTGRAALRRLAALEAAVLLGTMGASVALSHLAPPQLVVHRSTNDELLVGYPLYGAPGLVGLFTQWRINLIFGPLALVLAVAYLAAYRRLSRTGRVWSAGRTAAWLLGCLALLLATCSGVGRYAPGMFSLHITAHMLVSMLVPVLLVLGDPLTLLRSVSPGERFGPKLTEIGRSAPVRFLTHPGVALVLFAGSPFALYFTDLWDVVVRFHWAHQAVDAYFLAVGYLFCWIVIGGDPAPRTIPNLARLGLLLAAMPLDTVFAALLMTTHRVIGNGAASSNFYSALGLPWVPNLLTDQRHAGEVAFVIGGVALLIALAAVLLRWSADDEIERTAALAGYRLADPGDPVPTGDPGAGTGA